MLRQLEWAGVTEGQGANMGDLGPLGPCCPICRGVKPGSLAGHFVKSAYGHKKGCKLQLLIR